MDKLKGKTKIKMARSSRERKIYIFQNYFIEDRRCWVYSCCRNRHDYRSWKYYYKRKKQWMK